jgi:hypothetical protein
MLNNQRVYYIKYEFILLELPLNRWNMMELGGFLVGISGGRISGWDEAMMCEAASMFGNNLFST